MAVVTLKSGPIANRDASPRVASNPFVARANLKEFVGTVSAANGDSIGSKYIFGSVPSNARVSEIKLYCDAVTSGAMDVGLYRTTEDGGAVVDADFFASGQSIADAIATGTEIQHESGVFGVEKIEQPLWQALGLSSDPGVLYDIVGTLTAGTTAAGDVSLKARWAE